MGVSASATASEIKRAFRKKVKELHPDTTGKLEDTAAFRRLVKAYEVLSDIQRRSMFDMAYATYEGSRGSSSRKGGFDYRVWLLERTDDESRAKLVFFDLLHQREDDAVAEFIKFSSERRNFSLADWFTREDFMDLGFILCEELVLRSQYYDAALLLMRIVAMERTYSYFKFFFPEVMALTVDVLLHRLEGTVSDELALDAWEQALELGFSPKEESVMLVKMAKAYSRIGDSFAAQACFDEALRLDKEVKVSVATRRQFGR